MIRLVLTVAGPEQEAFEAAVIQAGIDTFESCPEPGEAGWVALYLEQDEAAGILARLPRPLQVRQEPAPAWPADEPAVTVNFNEHGIRIEPGLSFGTGTHATTAMMLDWIAELRPTTMLDAGCGSGILSIAAAKAGARVTALDIDAEAVRATAHNRALNSVSFDLVRGPVASIRGSFDVVAANLLGVTLVELWPDLLALARVLLVSGILDEQQSEFLKQIPDAPAEIRRCDGWLAMRFPKA